MLSTTAVVIKNRMHDSYGDGSFVGPGSEELDQTRGLAAALAWQASQLRRPGEPDLPGLAVYNL